MAERMLKLVAGDLVAEINPSIGGSIAGFTWLGAGGPRPIMRQSGGSPDKVLEAASFPLVPYVNRIRGGQFTFRGRGVRLEPNMPGDPSPLHGQGWLGSWQVDRSDDRTAVLSFHHSASEWPWDYEARQEFSLDDLGFSLRLPCRNTSTDPMPCGLGQHP